MEEKLKLYMYDEVMGISLQLILYNRSSNIRKDNLKFIFELKINYVKRLSLCHRIECFVAFSGSFVKKTKSFAIVQRGNC